MNVRPLDERNVFLFIRVTFSFETAKNRDIWNQICYQIDEIMSASSFVEGSRPL